MSGIVSVVGAGVAIVILVILSMSVKMNSEWQESIVLRLGKYHRTAGAGLFFVIPLIDIPITVNKRIITTDLSGQQVLTQDNVTASIDAVMFSKIVNPKDSVIKVERLYLALEKLAQTTLRNVIGQMNLDDLLAKRHDVAERIKNDLDAAVSDWGVDVMRLELQDISLPDNMKRVMARQAEAEREKRGVIIASEGELAAAENLAKASDVLSTSEYGFALRQLSTLSDVSQDQSNTVVFYPTSALNPEGMLAAGLAARIPKPTDPNGKKRGGKEKED